MGGSNSAFMSISGKISGKKEMYNSNSIIFMVIFVGALIHLCFINYFSVSGGYGPATALLWGYMLIIFAIFFKTILSVKTKDFDSFNTSTTFQTMFLLSMMLWLVVLNVQYMFQLNTGKVPSSYYTYSTWTTIFILLQIFIYFFKENSMILQMFSYFSNRKSMNASNGNLSGMITSNTNIVSLATLFLIFVLIFIQHTILINFSVDVL